MDYTAEKLGHSSWRAGDHVSRQAKLSRHSQSASIPLRSIPADWLLKNLDKLRYLLYTVKNERLFFKPLHNIVFYHCCWIYRDFFAGPELQLIWKNQPKISSDMENKIISMLRKRCVNCWHWRAYPQYLGLSVSERTYGWFKMCLSRCWCAFCAWCHWRICINMGQEVSKDFKVMVWKSGESKHLLQVSAGTEKADLHYQCDWGN